MPRNPKHKNIIQIFRTLISYHLKNDILLERAVWLERTKINGLSEEYAENFRRCLTILGYVEESDTNTAFRCVKNISFKKYYKDILYDAKVLREKIRNESKT